MIAAALPKFILAASTYDLTVLSNNPYYGNTDADQTVRQRRY